jgi:RHS repeat-associated protein
MTTEHNYDNKKRLSGYKHTIGATERNYGYEYESGFIGRLKKVTLPNNFTQNYEYDAMGRANGAALKRADGSALLREYGYYVKAGDHATNMLSSARYGVNGAVTEQLKYGYDARGNIASVTENGRLKARYFYDGLNRLIREDNADFNRTYAFTYDNGGNILTKTENNLSFGDSFTPVKVIPYVYDPDWKDLLLSYDGEECQYDGNDAVKFGNPTKYRDIGCTYSYGGRLMSMAQGGDTLNFTYDASGTRKSKGTTQYIYENGQLIRQSTGGDALDFYYDAGGVMGFKRGDDDYFFRKNPQGDVTHIYSIAGKLQAYYAYDAWGNCKVTCYDVNENAIAETDPAFETHIGNINPIRYRSYYFDTETGLYYLMSRYYDPETGRFINADNAEVAIALQGDMLNGLNLYSYSMNNPVNFSDPSGHSITLGIILLLTLGLAAAGATVGGVQAAANGGNVWDGIWKGALIGGMVGLSVSLMGAGIFGFAGFGTAGALGFGGMFAANAGIAASMAFSAGMTSFMALNSTVNANQGNFSTMNMGQAFKSWGSGVIIGGMTGALTFGIGTVLKPLGSSIEYGLGLIGKGGLTIGKFIGPAAWAGLMSAGRLLGAGASILMSREFMTYTGLNPNGKSVLQYILA